MPHPLDWTFPSRKTATNRAARRCAAMGLDESARTDGLKISPRLSLRDQLLWDVGPLHADDRHVVERVAVRGQPVGVDLLGALVHYAGLEQLPDQPAEPGRLAVVEEVLLDVEGDPAAVRDEVERLRESERGDVAEAERRDGHEAVEAVGAELVAVRSGERRQVEHVVALVDAGTVALCGGRGLGEEVDAYDRLGTQFGELLARHAVAGAEVEHAQGRGV